MSEWGNPLWIKRGNKSNERIVVYGAVGGDFDETFVAFASVSSAFMMMIIIIIIISMKHKLYDFSVRVCLAREKLYLD